MFEEEEFIIQLAVETELSLKQCDILLDNLMTFYGLEVIKEIYKKHDIAGLYQLQEISKVVYFKK